MDKLLAKLSEQQVALSQQNEALKSGEEDSFSSKVPDQGSSSNSLPITPATDGFPSTAPTTRPASASLDDGRQEEEVLRLKLQLARAQNHISKLDQELAQSRTTQSETEPTDPGPPRSKGPIPSDNPWPVVEDCQSDTSDTLPTGAFDRARGIWGNTKTAFANAPIQAPVAEVSPANWFGGRGFNPGYMEPASSYAGSDGPRGDRLTPDSDLLVRPTGGRRGNRFDSRLNSPHPFGGTYSGFNTPNGQYEPMMGGPLPSAPMPGAHVNGPPSMNPMALGMYPQAQQHVGTQLSPYASEFTSKAGWKNEVCSNFFIRVLDSKLTTSNLQMAPSEGPTYLPPTEPLNYRRLLDRNVNCNWKYIVDKIVCNNDQQASIFLQQKLKVGTPEQKYEIVEAIVAQAYPLMVNRFGNFLVQRCFEHGTPEQVIKIAEAIRGNTLNLSMDPFGCHVVQKAFDSVPEEYKAIMVHELLRRIPETVIHRYACHVWQKLFELRWTESPPQIMKYVNEALRGMWHEVALGETGSLVVQNIFENCLEEDKVCDSIQF